MELSEEARKALGRVLREARIARASNQEAVAGAAGIKRQAVGQWEKGETSPNLNNLTLACAFLGINVNDALAGKLTWIKAGSSDQLPRQPRVAEYEIAAEDAPIPRGLGRDVPIKGVAVGGKSGAFHMNGTTVDWARRPPTLAGTAGAFAIYVTSDSMWPRFEPGDLVYINPDRPPNIGDDVIIELYPEEGEANGDAFIKRLKRRTEKHIICEQFNPRRDVRFETARVKNILRIVPTRELYGV